jgi:phage-related protein
VLHIHKGCQKEIEAFPEGVRGDLADAVARLEYGLTVALPLSRPMPSIGAGVHEFRFRDRAGVYRIIYCFAGAGTLWLLHAFVKKTEKTSSRNIDIAKKRLREIHR